MGEDAFGWIRKRLEVSYKALNFLDFRIVTTMMMTTATTMRFFAFVTMILIG